MSLIPHSIRRSASLAALSDLAVDEMSALRELAAVLRIMDIDQVTAEVLPFLAWQLRADVWLPQASEALRRDQVRQALLAWRYRGTRYAVELALANLGVDAEVTEWFETDPQGTPHTFSVSCTATANWNGDDGGTFIGPMLQADILHVIGAVKPVRSQFDLLVGVGFSAAISIGGRFSARFLVSVVLVRARFDAT